MPVSSVAQQVRDGLPFLEDAAEDNALIERKRVEMTYLMQDQTGKTAAEVELEAEYSNLENMMFAEMVKYVIAKIRVTENMEGSSAEGGAAPGARSLKKAKADVVESEFQIIKASDGSRFQMLTKDWFALCRQQICSYSSVLNYSNPLCFDDDGDTANITPFIKGDDFPPNQPNPDKLFIY